MADFTVGASAVPGADAAITHGTAGAALAINQLVYLDTSQSPEKWELVDADNAITADTRVGIALHAAIENGPVAVQEGGKLTMSGASGTKGTPVFASTTAGALAPFADLASGDYPIYVGMWYSATVLDIRRHVLGVAI
jgi:hypothetical protein